MPIKLVRSIDRQMTAALVEIHQQSFQGFFLTFLGPRFIAELYRSIVLDPSGIACIAWNDNRVSGFVVGSTQPSGLYTRLLRRRWWQFGWAALPALLRKPTILLRLLRAFSMPGQEQPAENCALLMSIAVHPNFQGLGVGRQLVQAFLAESRQRGLDAVNLTTDADDNEATNRFYQSTGFSLARTFTTPEGRRMNEYLIQL